MATTTKARPLLNGTLSGDELMRWYWLREELAAFAGQVGVSAAGSKEALQQRLAAYLDGRVDDAPAPTTGRRSGTQLSGLLSESKVVPRGQRCSQHLRAWFETQLGPGFRFDSEMRQWFAETDGSATLGDAMRHWHFTRSRTPQVIGRQFEFNRFTRSWHAAHPGGTREELMDAWREYRALPVDVRGRA